MSQKKACHRGPVINYAPFQELRLTNSHGTELVILPFEENELPLPLNRASMEQKQEFDLPTSGDVDPAVEPTGRYWYQLTSNSNGDWQCFNPSSSPGY